MITCFKLHIVFIRICACFMYVILAIVYAIMHTEHFCNQFPTTSHNYFNEHTNFKELKLNFITITEPGLSVF